MKKSNRRLLTPALTALFCLVVLLVVLALALRDGAADDSAAIGFPIVLVVLAVLATAGALVWKAVSKASRR